jgi:hypothetical protein
MRISPLTRHPLALIGMVVTTSAAVVFITLVIAMLAGMLSNPYAGLVMFVAIPAVFVVGLLLIPAGASWCAIPGRSPNGRSSTSAARTSGGPR